MKLLSKIPSWLKNKYFLTAVGFAVWVLFFDDRDFITTQFRHRAELRSLEKSKKYYEAQIAATREELMKLKTNPAVIEKYAREKFLMKRENEDLFLVPQK
jgi:cell division protein DivIC